VSQSNTSGLIDAINQANADGIDSVICLAGGEYVLTSVYADFTGLPPITTPIEILGNGAVIRRDTSMPDFRLMRVERAPFTLRNVQLQHGSINGRGGGIFNLEGTMTLDNVNFQENMAFDGAGFYTSAGDVTMQGGSLYMNTATNFGGGFVNRSTSSVFLNNVLIRQNSAPNGGGFYNQGTYVEVRNSQIDNNTADMGGGIYNYSFGQVLLLDTVLSDNDSLNFGGGVSTDSSDMRVNESCITGNVSQLGGGVFNASATSDPMDATYNWWGASDGPGGAGGGSGDSITEKILFEPFYTAALPICGGSSNPPLSP
jgi:hypothetical protein